MIFVTDVEEKRIKDLHDKAHELRKEFNERFVKVETDLKSFNYLHDNNKKEVTVKKGSYVYIDGIWIDNDKVEVDFQIPLNAKQIFKGKKYFYLFDKTSADIEKWFRSTFSTNGRTSKADWSYKEACEIQEKANEKQNKKLTKWNCSVWITFLMSLFTYMSTFDMTLGGEFYEALLPKFLALPSLILTIVAGIVAVGSGIYEHNIKKGVYVDDFCWDDNKEYWERDRKKHRRYEKITGKDVDDLTDYDMINSYIQLLESEATEDYIYHFNPLEKFDMEMGLADKKSTDKPKKDKKKKRDKKKDRDKTEKKAISPVKEEIKKDAFAESKPCETNGGKEAEIFNGIWEEYPMGLELFRTLHNDKKGA